MSTQLSQAELDYEENLLGLTPPTFNTDESQDSADVKRKRRILRAIALQMEALSF